MADGDDLRAAATEHCRAEFESAFGRPWDERQFANVVDPEPLQREQEARQILRKASALLETGHGAPEPGGALALLRRMLPPSARRELATPLPPSLVGSIRTRLAHEISRYDVLSAGRPLTAREAALISILLGNWPSLRHREADGWTVADVVADEAIAMRRALEREQR